MDKFLVRRGGELAAADGPQPLDPLSLFQVRRDVDKTMAPLRSQSGKKRGKNIKTTNEERLTIVKYALEHGVSKSVKKCKRNESTVRGWRNQYTKARKRNDMEAWTDSDALTSLTCKKRGRPSFIPEQQFE